LFPSLPIAIIFPMPRRSRLAIKDVPHLICQRSLDGAPLFQTQTDYSEYLRTLKQQAAFYQADILAYCLLKNRVHLILIPRKKDSLARTVGRTHFWFAQYRNRRTKQNGKLWHDRFHSCPIDPKLIAQVVKFVESQPVCNKIVRKPEKYPWSSARLHIESKDENQIVNLAAWSPKKLKNRWLDILNQKIDPQLFSQLQLNTQTGRPWGSDAFISALETKLKQRLHALPIGRPANQ